MAKPVSSPPMRDVPAGLADALADCYVLLLRARRRRRRRAGGADPLAGAGDGMANARGGSEVGNSGPGGV